MQLREPRERLSRRALTMWRLGGLLQALVVSVALTALGWLTLGRHWWHWWYVAAYLALLVALAVVVPAWRWAVHRWEVTETAVYTQTGWWALERRIAPMSRIQTVDYHERPLARLLGLASVTVTTASAAGALRIDGLDRATAQRLSDDLTSQADAVPGDAT